MSASTTIETDSARARDVVRELEAAIAAIDVNGEPVPRQRQALNARRLRLQAIKRGVAEGTQTCARLEARVAEWTRERENTRRLIADLKSARHPHDDGDPMADFHREERRAATTAALLYAEGRGGAGDFEPGPIVAWRQRHSDVDRIVPLVVVEQLLSAAQRDLADARARVESAITEWDAERKT
jgi:hypothetical protein